MRANPTAEGGQWRNRGRWLGRFALLLLLVVGLLVAGFLLWGVTPADPMPEALEALRSDEIVTVTQGEQLVFEPTGEAPSSGFIFYPGGRVDPRSYAPVARALAERGHVVVIVPMPLNLAVFAPMRAADVIAARPRIERWAVGGHSLGGAMAARFVRDEPELADALFLWAAYPANTDDLSALPLSMASVYGTYDGIALPEVVRAAEQRLAPDTSWVPIEGGNHAQFGSYGPQRGDREATISRETQQADAVEATAGLLEPSD